MPSFLAAITAATLSAAAAPPQARAGRAFLGYPGETIELNGSASDDPDGDALTGWTWAQVGGPEVPLQSSDGPRPRFRADLPGTYRFTLQVEAGGERSDADGVDVIIVDPEAGTRYTPAEGGCATLSRGAAPALAGLALVFVARRRD